MGTAYLYFTDHAGSFAQLTFQHAETGSEPGSTVSPTPRESECDIVNAIVLHEVPSLGYDKVQDMGCHAQIVPLTGLIRKGDRDSLKTRAEADQTTATYANGRWRYRLIDSGGVTAEDINPCVIKRFKTRYIGGLKGWFEYLLILIHSAP